MLQDKLELRKQLIKQRNAVGKAYGTASSKLICENILASEFYKSAQGIMAYLSFGNEVCVDRVLEQALREGKKVYVPHIVSRTEFLPAELADMKNFVLDRYGIRSIAEPVILENLEKIDLVLVPGVAFAKDGGRMGMGAGYYDRFLLKVPKANLLGVAYEEMVQFSLPIDEHDVPIPFLVTEGGVVKTTC